MYVITARYRLKPEEARLAYPTLDEALDKLRDLIEADEVDEDADAPMFSHYIVSVESDDPPEDDKPFKGMRLVSG